jgi:ABC-type nitrate/sulfonate/bicarbonate transport system permease component
MPSPESTSIVVALWQSATTLALGYLPAVVLGLLLGWLISSHPLLCQIGKRLLQLPIAVPAAYVPLFLLLTNSNQFAAILTIFFSSPWFIAIHTGLGLQRAFQHGNRYDLAIPQIFLGLRLGLTMAWGAVITAEIVMSGLSGLGYYVWDAYQNYSIPDLIIGIITIFFITFATDQLLDLLGIFVKKLLKREG